MEKKELETEWCLLQNQFDSYEKHSLYIKLLSIFILSVAEVLSALGVYLILILGVLWLQDAIWKTFQARIESRLIQIEECISGKIEANVFQFNSEFLNGRSGGLSLINEYVSQSIRPTVAFPHVVLILILLIQNIL